MEVPPASQANNASDAPASAGPGRFDRIATTSIYRADAVLRRLLAVQAHPLNRAACVTLHPEDALALGLGHGVAIPHGRIKGLKNPLAEVLRTQQAIGFDSPDDAPVSLLIFLLVPEAATQRHLEILSEIAEMLSDRELRERLVTEPDAAAVHQLIAAWQAQNSAA